MDFCSLRNIPVLDAHIHLPYPSQIQDLERLTHEMGIDRINLVSTPDIEAVNHNPTVLQYKALHPTTTYICGGLDHFSVQSNPARMPEAFAQQVIALSAAGFDGLKLLESKPIARKMINIPLDGPIYAPMWAEMEKLAFPVVWHVADPEEFWDPEKCPDWVKKSGWFLWGWHLPALKETLYSEVEAIVQPLSEIKSNSGPFLFLVRGSSACGGLFGCAPNVCFDLTPGSEMFFNLHGRPGSDERFFIRVSNRLIFVRDTGPAPSINRTCP